MMEKGRLEYGSTAIQDAGGDVVVYEDDRDHIHRDWRGGARFLLMMVYYQAIDHVSARAAMLQGIFRGKIVQLEMQRVGDESM